MPGGKSKYVLIPVGRIERCTRCGLPLNWGITILDEQGVCNHCRFYDSVKEKLCDFDRWQGVFSAHLDQHKGKFKYDVVVGFSGGKDSSYIVNTLKKQYKCKVLAVTVNFGFMPTPVAMDNSKRVAECLGVDHIIYDATTAPIQAAFKNAVEKGQLCGLCTGLCTAFTRKIAIERQIPFIIMGADRGQLLRSLAPETGPMSGAGAISGMLKPYADEKTLRGDNPRRVKSMRGWLRGFGLSPEAGAEIFPVAERLPGTNAVPLSLQFFMFHAYNEKEIKRTLENEANWQLPAGDYLHAHHDCEFHQAVTYYFRQAVGTTITAGEICVDVREGGISRNEAIEALDKEANQLDQMQQPYDVFNEYFGIPDKFLNRAAKRYKRRMAILIALRKFQMLFCKPKLKQLDQL